MSVYKLMRLAIYLFLNESHKTARGMSLDVCEPKEETSAQSDTYRFASKL